MELNKKYIAQDTLIYKRTKTRWMMLSLIMLVMCINYLDRGNLAVSAPIIQEELGINAATMGLLFSAFAWSYALIIPFAGVLLDKIGPKIMFTIGIIGWSIFTFFIGAVNTFATLVSCRLGVGIFEAPTIPTNVRCVTAWFPEKERALAVGMYTAMQYVALGFLTPVLTWILLNWGWRMIFYITGGVGLIVGIVWYSIYNDPKDSKIVNNAELDYISMGGGLINAGEEKTKKTFSWKIVRQLFCERQLVGMFIGHFSIMTTLFFFMTWFPSYLITAKGLTILKTGFYSMVPFLVAILGALIGGKWSDWMITHGCSKSTARKAPIIMGFILSVVILGANYTDNIDFVISFMAVAFFGQAMSSAVTGALLADIAPIEAIGLSGGLLNFIANIGSALSPMIVGFIVQLTGSFNWALVYVSAISGIGLFAYLFIIGDVYRIELPKELE
ncbi:MAG: major facilitator superfamily 1 [Firmicutes bacterium]|nr:major facilitator superfamily 1 [Bacillota bacterium]